jgi:hypothetical protein
MQIEALDIDFGMRLLKGMFSIAVKRLTAREQMFLHHADRSRLVDWQPEKRGCQQ